MLIPRFAIVLFVVLLLIWGGALAIGWVQGSNPAPSATVTPAPLSRDALREKRLKDFERIERERQAGLTDADREAERRRELDASADYFLRYPDELADRYDFMRAVTSGDDWVVRFDRLRTETRNRLMELEVSPSW